jgi:hypothetical protein
MLRAMRPHQWLKNLLVFVPIIADPAHGGWEWSWVLAAFVALSLAASAGYIINDLLDLADDRTIRASATGPSRAATCRWRRARAWCLSCCSWLGGRRPRSRGNSWRGGDLFRADHGLFPQAEAPFDHRYLHARRALHDPHRGGAIAIGVFPSVWLLAFSMFTFFALAAAKRLGELSDADAAGRTVTRRGYTVEDRRILSQMAISAGYVGVLVLALYIDEPRCRSASAPTGCSGGLRAADLLDQPAGPGGQPGPDGR